MLNDKATSAEIAAYMRDVRHHTGDGRSEDGEAHVFPPLYGDDLGRCSDDLWQGYHDERGLYWPWFIATAIIGTAALWFIADMALETVRAINACGKC